MLMEFMRFSCASKQCIPSMTTHLFFSARIAHKASSSVWTYSDLETLIGQDEGGVGGSELGGRHYWWC